MKVQAIIVFATQHMATGGIESHLKEFCYNLSKTGTKIDLVVLNSEMNLETKKLYEKVCRKVYLGNNTSSLQRVFWLLKIALKLLFKKYSAIYTNGQGESVFLFSKLLPFYKKWVHHHHTAADQADQATWNNSYRKTLSSATSVIACSTSNAFDLTMAVNRPIISIPCFSRKVTRKQRLTQGKCRFGYFGRLIPEKGIDLLSKLSEDEDLQNVEFHIWGEGKQYPESYFKNLRNLKYHGSFNGQKELSAVIEFIDCFLLLSTHPEGLPICLLEAMSAGLPWLATDKGGIKDIALDPTSTRVIPENADYARIKKEIISFAEDIKSGLVSSVNQIQLYNKRFAASAIVLQWQKELGLIQSFKE